MARTGRRVIHHTHDQLSTPGDSSAHRFPLPNGSTAVRIIATFAP
jgi:hypothetical protein